MGYESKIFLIQDSKGSEEAGKTFGNVIAMFDAGKTHDDLVNVFIDPAPVYFYDCSGKKLNKDNYNQEPTYTTVEAFLEVSKSFSAKTSPTLNKIAKAIKALAKGEKNLIVVHMGY